ncbi:hypothetical protein M569_11949, partial [Genlisea aurea]
MKEIVTIQVGSYANFVGSHFWNFQDELLGLAESDDNFKNHGLNMDVLYRTGETQQGILTYTPRLVSVDFQGSLGALSCHGTLYNRPTKASTDSSVWRGPVTTLASQPIKKNLFLQSLDSEENECANKSNCEGSSYSDDEIQDKSIVECLENEVQYWTDFSKVYFHPKSLYELHSFWSDFNDFSNYGIGREAFSTDSHAEDVNERLRFFVEECDLPQGIQFIVDDYGGFAGVAGEFLENIADEYTNIPVLLYNVRNSCSNNLDATNRKQAISRKLHDAVSFTTLSSFCQLIVPVGLPSLNTGRLAKYLTLEDQKPYHSSAIYASAICSMSLPSRIEPLCPSPHTFGSITINELTQMLAGQGRQNTVSILDIAMPAPPLSGGKRSHQIFLKNLQALSPDIDEGIEDIEALESIIVHGAFASGLKRASTSEVKYAVQDGYSKMEVKPKFYNVSVADCPLPIPLPFPSIFGSSIGEYGEEEVVHDPERLKRVDVKSVPMAARLRSSKAVLPFLEKRLDSLRGMGGSELFRNWGFGKEDVDEIAETLSSMVMRLKGGDDYDSD